MWYFAGGNSWTCSTSMMPWWQLQSAYPNAIFATHLAMTTPRLYWKGWDAPAVSLVANESGVARVICGLVTAEALGALGCSWIVGPPQGLPKSWGSSGGHLDFLIRVCRVGEPWTPELELRFQGVVQPSKPEVRQEHVHGLTAQIWSSMHYAPDAELE